MPKSNMLTDELIEAAKKLDRANKRAAKKAERYLPLLQVMIDCAESHKNLELKIGGENAKH